jgi:hypothetical protein
MTHTTWAESMTGKELARIYSWGNDPWRKGEYELSSPCRHADLPQTKLEPLLIREASLRGTVGLACPSLIIESPVQHSIPKLRRKGRLRPDDCTGSNNE